MKKFITLLLAVLMVASLAACGSNSSAPAADGSAEASSEPAASSVQLKILDSEYVTEDYAIAIAKENTDLLDSVNAALTALIADGTVAQVVDFYVSGEGELPAVQEDVAADAETLTMATSRTSRLTPRCSPWPPTPRSLLMSTGKATPSSASTL